MTQSLPLQIAALDLRFPGDPEVEVIRGRFYQAIRNDFPELYVPIARPEQSLALQPYTFTKGNHRSINIALNMFNYIVDGANYGSFEAFKKKFLHYFEIFREHYTFLPGLTRIGLRYTNHLPLEHDASGLIINTPLKLPKVNDRPQRAINLISELPIRNGILQVQINTNFEEATFPRQVLLDFDYYFVGTVQAPIPLTKLNDHIEEAHQVTKEFLNDIVDKHYLEEVGIT